MHACMHTPPVFASLKENRRTQQSLGEWIQIHHFSEDVFAASQTKKMEKGIKSYGFYHDGQAGRPGWASQPTFSAI